MDFAALKRMLFVEMTITLILGGGFMVAGFTVNFWLLPLVRMFPGQGDQMLAFFGVMTFITGWIALYAYMHRRTAKHYEEFRACLASRAAAEKEAAA